MQTTDLSDQIAAAVAAHFEGHKATAAKRGRNPRYPYVPVISRPSERFGSSTSQILRRAFEDRAAAVECAERHLEAERRKLTEDLALPNHRAQREHYGLPREI